MEIWKPLARSEKYLCSTSGRIRNAVSGKICNGSVNNHGYVRFDLCENGKRFVISGHHAVAETFIENPMSLSSINHIDGNKTNNNVSNLEWCTAKHNTHHAIHTLLKSIGGENKKKVICLETGKVYSSCCEAEMLLGIPNSLINRCCNGKRKTTRGLHFAFI